MFKYNELKKEITNFFKNYKVIYHNGKKISNPDISLAPDMIEIEKARFGIKAVDKSGNIFKQWSVPYRSFKNLPCDFTKSEREVLRQYDSLRKQNALNDQVKDKYKKVVFAKLSDIIDELFGNT